MWKQWPNLDIKADLCLRRSGTRNLYYNICADIAFNELQIMPSEADKSLKFSLVPHPKCQASTCCFSMWKQWPNLDIKADLCLRSGTRNLYCNICADIAFNELQIMPSEADKSLKFSLVPNPKCQASTCCFSMWKQWPNLDIKADLFLRRSGTRNFYCNICADIAFKELQIMPSEADKSLKFSLVPNPKCQASTCCFSMWKQWPNLDIKADLCLRRSGTRNLYCNICADIAFNKLQILAIEWPSDHQVVYSHASDNLSIVSLCVAVGEFSVSACISILGNKAVSKCQ